MDTGTPPTSSRRTSLALASLVVALALVVAFLAYQVNSLSQQVHSVQGQLVALELQAGKLETNVDYIIPIAENANRWAHCHPDSFGGGCY